MAKAKTKTAPEFDTPEQIKAEYDAALAQGESLGSKVGTYRPSKTVALQVMGPHPDFDQACLVKFDGEPSTCWINDNPMPPQASVIKVRIKASRTGEWHNLSYTGEIVE